MSPFFSFVFIAISAMFNVINDFLISRIQGKDFFKVHDCRYIAFLFLLYPIIGQILICFNQDFLFRSFFHIPFRIGILDIVFIRLFGQDTISFQWYQGCWRFLRASTMLVRNPDVTSSIFVNTESACRSWSR